MKAVVLLSLLSLSFCFKAVRSPYDTSTPSGAVMSYLSGLKPVVTTPTPIQIEKNRIRFVAKGTQLTYQIPSAENFTDFSFEPALPNGFSLDSQTGLITCECLSNTPFFRGNFVLNYKSKIKKESFSLELAIEVYSPGTPLAPAEGVTLNNNQELKNPSAVVYNDSLYVVVVSTYENTLYLAKWNGTGTGWELKYVSSGSSFFHPIAKVHNGKIYIFYTDNSYLYLDKYDETGYGNIGFSNSSYNYLNMISHNETLYMIAVDSSGGSLTTYMNSFGASSNSTFAPFLTAQEPSLLSFNGDLYMGYYTSDVPYSLNLAKWNGGDWTLAFSSATTNITQVSGLASYKNEFYIGWIENNSFYVGRWNGTLAYSQLISNGSETINDATLFASQDKLYAVYACSNSSTSYYLKYRSFDGTNWGPESNDLKVAPNPSFYNLQIVEWNELPILIWHEQTNNGTYIDRIHARVLE